MLTYFFTARTSQTAHALLCTGGSVISSAVACTSQGTRCLTHSLIHLVVPLPKWLVAGLSPPSPGLDLTSLNVRFVLDKVEL